MSLSVAVIAHLTMTRMTRTRMRRGGRSADAVPLKMTMARLVMASTLLQTKGKPNKPTKKSEKSLF